MALTTDLKAYWNLNSDVTDSVGSNDGTVIGASNVSGHIDNCYQFDGTNDYISVPDSADFDIGTGDFSVAFWMYKIATGVNDRLFTKKDDVGWQDTPGFTIRQNSAGTGMYLVLADGTNIAFGEITNTSATSTWEHYVVNFDRSGNAEIFVDTVSQGTLDISGVTGSVDNSIIITMASNWDEGAPGSFSNIRLDEVGFWNRLLTSGERTSLYNSGSGLAYPFGEGGGVVDDAIFLGVNF